MAVMRLRISRLLGALAAPVIVFCGLWGAAFAPLMRSGLAPILAFFGAVREGDIAGVREELSKGANPNAVDDAGKTALVYGVVSGNKELVQLLLASGARADLRDAMGN